MTRTRRLAPRAAAAGLLALLLVFGSVQVAFAERTIALSTGTVQMSLAAGGSAADKIAIANNGDEPLSAFVYTNDVQYTAEGLPEYVRPTGTSAELLTSPASWLSLRLPAETQVIANTPYIDLEPGEEMILEFEIRVPENVPPGDYNAIVFFEMFDNSTAAGTSSKVAGRIGARIVVRVAGEVVERLEVAPFWVRSFVIGQAVPYKFTFKNDGNIDKRYTPSLVVLDGSEAEVQRKVLEESAIVYAGNARVYSGSLALDRSLFGRYTVRTEIQYDKDGAQTGALRQWLQEDRSVWIVPLWVVILVVLLASTPLLYLAWRRTNRVPTRTRMRRTSTRGLDDADTIAPDTAAEES